MKEGIYANLETTKGLIVVSLEYEKTPGTVGNFISLAEGKIKNSHKKTGTPYYDGIIFHRVIPGFMAQSGDPLGNGTGGSGKNLKAEFSDYRFTSGTVGMARAMDPNSADSQFFICFDGCAHLSGQYTAWGQVEKGMEIVESINVGEPPSDPDKIISAKITN